MRLPVPVVTTHLKAVLEGILLWSADTKNQFKLKVGNPTARNTTPQLGQA